MKKNWPRPSSAEVRVVSTGQRTEFRKRDGRAEQFVDILRSIGETRPIKSLSSRRFLRRSRTTASPISASPPAHRSFASMPVRCSGQGAVILAPTRSSSSPRSLASSWLPVCLR